MGRAVIKSTPVICGVLQHTATHAFILKLIQRRLTSGHVQFFSFSTIGYERNSAELRSPAEMESSSFRDCQVGNSTSRIVMWQNDHYFAEERRRDS